MPNNFVQGDQYGIDIALPNIHSSTKETMNNLGALIDNKLYIPFEPSIVGTTITLKATQCSITKSTGSGSTSNIYKMDIAPIAGIFNSFAQSTLNILNGNITGSFSPSTTCPSFSANLYVNMGFTCKSDGFIYVVWGTPNAVKSSATLPVFNDFPIGYITLQVNGTGGSWAFLAPTITDFIFFNNSSATGPGLNSSNPTFITFTPSASGGLVNNSIYIDSTTFAFGYKTNSGSVVPLASKSSVDNLRHAISDEYNFGNATGGITINFDNGVSQKLVLTGDVTSITFQNMLSGRAYVLRILQDSTSRTIAWPVSVLWGDSGEPNISAINKTSIISLYYDGSSFYGNAALGF